MPERPRPATQLLHSTRSDEPSTRPSRDRLFLLIYDDLRSLAASLMRNEAPRAARVVELRLFTDLKAAEIADVLGVSERTVSGDWAFARRFLARELG